jgi:hypothetical protein
MVHNILGHSSKFIETTAKNKKTKFFSENITEIGRNALQSSFGDCFALQLKRLATPGLVVKADGS